MNHESLPVMLDVSSRSRLKEQVLLARGVIRIFVHPYYKIDEPKDWYWMGLEAIWRSMGRLSLPIVVTEGKGTMEALRLKLREKVNKENLGKVYMVSTYDQMAEPNEGWGQMIGNLKFAGVKKCLVGGQRMWIEKEEKLNYPLGDQLERQRLNKYWVFGCVGGTMRTLADRGVEVVVSNIVSPDKRSDFFR